MPRPANVAKIVVRGTLPGGERFATGWWETTPGDTVTAQQTADALVASGFFTAWITAVKALLVTTASYTAVDVYLYRTAGPVTDKGTAAIASGAGTGGANQTNQVSCVMSLRSATLTRSGRGRMYLPATGLGMAANGLFSSGPVQTAVTATAGLLSQRDALIVSPTRTATYPVTSVDADYVPDIVRARVDKLTSGRFSANVT